ncbi:MAG: amidase, partial [Acetobacterales bacterium]
MRDDRFGAFCIHDAATLSPTGEGPLAGCGFAVKDLFDIAGHVTGCGNPDWFRTHQAAHETAPAVRRCLAAGAGMAGKTKTVEMAFSLTGENPHYGTPENPAAPGRLPGGSSCGSAAAVAGGAVDFALGTDTGGSVRIPASYCGLYGFRPTHGRVDISGVVPLAPSFDTVGWFTRDIGLLAAVGDALLQGDSRPLRPKALLCPVEAWAGADDDVDAALRPALAAAGQAIAKPRFEALSDNGLAGWYGIFRPIQAYEAWQCHGAWIQAEQPAFGPGVRERFQFCSTVDEQTVVRARAARARIDHMLRERLGEHTVLVLPTSPVPAPS